MAIKNGQTMKVELELRNYKNINEFMECNIDVDAQMNTKRYRYNSSRNMPVTVCLEDIGINRRDITFSSGNNIWTDIEYVNKFGITNHMMINNKVFEEMPWTVWFDGDDKYYPRWCGKLFATEEEAQEWIDVHDTNE